MGLAYRMLGTVEDAEDVVQDAYVRLRTSAAAPDNEEAYLFRVVTNLALDRLRHLKIQRDHYPGPWVPEPVADASAMAELAEGLNLAFVFMLERLTPAERVVYVLREGFDQSFNDIADVLGVSVDAARQRLRRAKSRLAGESIPQPSIPQESNLLDRLLMAVAEDDITQLVSLLHKDAVAYTDGGGVVSAAVIPVTEPARIAQVTRHLVRKAFAEGGLAWDRQERFGSVQLILRQNGVVHSVTQIGVRDGLVHRVYVVRNPEKLAAFAGADDVN